MMLDSMIIPPGGSFPADNESTRQLGNNGGLLTPAEWRDSRSTASRTPEIRLAQRVTRWSSEHDASAARIG
jgi:hypothetical protein